MKMTKTISWAVDGVETLDVILYDNLEEAMLEFINSSEDNDKKLTLDASTDDTILIGYDQEGKRYSFNLKTIMRMYRNKKTFGFVADKEVIHLWIDDDASIEATIRLIAHELGHVRKPYYKRQKNEEMKAGAYEDVAVMAYKLAKEYEKGGFKDVCEE